MLVDLVEDVSNFMKNYCENNIDLTIKESGHSYSDRIESLTKKYIIEKAAEYGLDYIDPPKKRDKFDIIVVDEFSKKRGINIKFGSSYELGQPNICSMKKILKSYIIPDNRLELMKEGYWIFKIRILNDDLKDVSISFFNIFDKPHCLTYNTGTGQVMLDERKFYDQLPYTSSPEDFLDIIHNLYVSGYKKHIQKKAREYRETYGLLKNIINQLKLEKGVDGDSEK
jgi:hypothetical protein